jgi:RNA polymerase sigma-70 factor (ECF subfamily)
MQKHGALIDFANIPPISGGGGR